MIITLYQVPSQRLYNPFMMDHTHAGGKWKIWENDDLFFKLLVDYIYDALNKIDRYEKAEKSKELILELQKQMNELSQALGCWWLHCHEFHSQCSRIIMRSFHSFLVSCSQRQRLHLIYKTSTLEILGNFLLTFLE